MPTQTCPACQESIRDTAVFCSYCGTELARTLLLSPPALLQGRYRIVEQMGGGMSTVYRVLDTKLDDTVRVVKSIRAPQQGTPQADDDSLKQFEREAKILAKLNHTKLPKVSDFFVERGRYFLVMDYVDGKDLRWILEHRPGDMTAEWVVDRVLELCEVLEYLHKQSPPVIFRDLKPSNIMVTREGPIKLIDFGIARFFQPHGLKDTQVLGTPGYAAPEQYRGETDPRSDIYGLGVVLHELLTLHDPSVPPLRLPRLCDLRPDLAMGLEVITVTSTRSDPDDRYQSIGEFRDALAGVAALYRDPSDWSVIYRTEKNRRRPIGTGGTTP